MNERNDIYPAFTHDCATIVFAVDRFYLPYLSVAIQSLIEHSDPSKNYDIVIIYTELNQEDTQRFLNGFITPNNISLRFVNVSTYVNEYEDYDYYIEIHVTLATYLRFFLGSIFQHYKHILYFDCDIVIEDDVFKLYSIDLNGCTIGAVRDVREVFFSFLNGVTSGRNWKNYVEKDLGLEDYRRYFQAGVLSIDLEKFREKGTQQRLLSKLREISKPILSDQDILNATLKTEVLYLPSRWNVEWQIPFEFPDYLESMPKDLSRDYCEGCSTAAIIHYASPIKPWKNWENGYKFSNIWWTYARRSPFYEWFLLRWVFSTKNKYMTMCLTKLINGLLPSGTKRRSFLKAIKRGLYLNGFKNG